MPMKPSIEIDAAEAMKMLQQQRGGDRPRPAELEAEAEGQMRAALEASPWLQEKLPGRIQALLDMNASRRSKSAALIRLVDEVGEALAPHSACRRGCNHCCHIPVHVFQSEAVRIAEVTGRVVSQITSLRPPAPGVSESRYRGVPCPFLKEGECSIYEARPFACRQHYVLLKTSAQCDLAVPSVESFVPTAPEMAMVELAYGSLKAGVEPGADIREFFPD